MPPVVEPRFDELVKVIASAQADVIIVGGIAMILQGADYLTLDFDVCYRREPATIARLCRALAPHCELLRSAILDIQDALLTTDTTLLTDFGRLDLLGALAGIGDYEQVARLARTVQVEDVTVRVLGIDGLIATKEAIMREKDKLHLPSLRALKALNDEGEL
jgi:hypothetical protein